MKWETEEIFLDDFSLTSGSSDLVLSGSVISLSSWEPDTDSVLSFLLKKTKSKYYCLINHKPPAFHYIEHTHSHTPEGTGVLGWVGTGLAGTGVLGSDETLSVSFFSSNPTGIKSGVLNFPFTCSNSWTYIHNKNKSKRKYK